MRLNSKRLIALALVIAVLVCSGILSTRLQIDEDVTNLLPSSDPLVSDYRLVVTRFKGLESIFVDIGADGDSSDSTIEVVSAADAMATCLAESDLFKKIHYRIPAEEAGKILTLLSARRASLFSLEDIEKLELRLSLKNIRERLRDIKRLLIEPSGPFVLERLRQDPLDFNELLLEKLRCVSRAGTASISDGRIWSGDSRHVLMILDPRSPAMDTGRGVEVIAVVERARQVALSRVPAGTVQISYIGGHRAALDNAQIIRKDVQVSLTITSLGIVVLGLLVFRHKIFVAMMFHILLKGCNRAGKRRHQTFVQRQLGGVRVEAVERRVENTFRNAAVDQLCDQLQSLSQFGVGIRDGGLVVLRRFANAF